MRKRVTHKQAYKAMKKIIRYCEQTPEICCEETCIFYDENHPTNCCVLATNINPQAWWMHKKNKNLIKKNLAEVLKCES